MRVLGGRRRRDGPHALVVDDLEVPRVQRHTTMECEARREGRVQPDRPRCRLRALGSPGRSGRSLRHLQTSLGRLHPLGMASHGVRKHRVAQGRQTRNRRDANDLQCMLGRGPQAGNEEVEEPQNDIQQGQYKQPLHEQECEERLSHIVWADDLILVRTSRSELTAMIADARSAVESVKLALDPNKTQTRTTHAHADGCLHTALGAVRTVGEVDTLGVRVSADRRAPGRARRAAAWRAFSAHRGIVCARSRPWRGSESLD